MVATVRKWWSRKRWVAQISVLATATVPLQVANVKLDSLGTTARLESAQKIVLVTENVTKMMALVHVKAGTLGLDVLSRMTLCVPTTVQITIMELANKLTPPAFRACVNVAGVAGIAHWTQGAQGD
jgi:hypothetical protein